MLKFKLLLFAYSLISYDNMEPSDRLIKPVAGETNIWSPAGTERHKCEIPWSPKMREYQDWANSHLQNGDLVHRLGDARLGRGLYPFSKVLAKITGSQYSHTGLISIENGEAVVYDTTKASVRRQPFGVYMLDAVGGWCVSRSDKLEATKAIGFARDRWLEQTPFDYDLSPDDKQLYCVELAVKAYRVGGVDLGKPTMLIAIPGIKQWKVTLYIFSKLGLKLFNRVWYVGNDKHGILSSPNIRTIFARQRGEPL